MLICARTRAYPKRDRAMRSGRRHTDTVCGMQFHLACSPIFRRSIKPRPTRTGRQQSRTRRGACSWCDHLSTIAYALVNRSRLVAGGMLHRQRPLLHCHPGQSLYGANIVTHARASRPTDEFFARPLRSLSETIKQFIPVRYRVSHSSQSATVQGGQVPLFAPKDLNPEDRTGLSTMGGWPVRAPYGVPDDVILLVHFLPNGDLTETTSGVRGIRRRTPIDTVGSLPIRQAVKMTNRA